MGKKAKLKQIRRIAAQMPEIKRKELVVDGKAKGSELIAKGIKEVNGQPVIENNTYIRKKAIGVPINHNRRMKDIYNKMGVQGVNSYIMAVKQFHAGTTKTAGVERSGQM